MLDCFDGSIQGFHVDGHMRAELCVKALEDACRKSGARGMIVHSDRGSQFTSHLFREVLKRHRAIQSMSGTGRCYDNARMESFFATLKKEKLYPVNTRTLTKEEVQSILFRYISYYNLRRISLVNGACRRWCTASSIWSGRGRPDRRRTTASIYLAARQW